MIQALVSTKIRVGSVMLIHFVNILSDCTGFAFANAREFKPNILGAGGSGSAQEGGNFTVSFCHCADCIPDDLGAFDADHVGHLV